MSRFREQFKNRHVFLPVVHAHTRTQVLRNVELATYNGADGVFLINHHIPVEELIEYYHAARERFPDVWIGLNMLRTTNRDAIGHVPETNCALWTDDAGVDDVSEGRAHDFFKSARKTGWQGLHFGGVAFKYQPQLKNIPDAARRAVPYVDVITTSAPETGVPPLPQKVMMIREAIGDHPLAVASGMTRRNVEQYGMADCFLVASSILVDGSWTEFDELKLLQFADSVRKMNEATAAVL